MEKLESLGYSSRFESRADAGMVEVHDVARVVSVHKERYDITKGAGEVFAELSGHLFYTADSAAELPTTGDWVYADFFDDETHAIIHGVLERKTLLKRKTAGKAVDFQLIAANIDTAFIVQSLDFNFNLRRRERYLAMVHEGGITPLVLLSKCDLMAADKVAEIRERVLSVAPLAEVIAFSNVSEENIAVIRAQLLAHHTYCLLGSSGGGKTTLLNTILGSEQFETKAVSKKLSKDRHTTTSRELIMLDNGAMLIDTPGMRELGNLAVDSGIDETFAEIAELLQQCKFSNCSHSNEQGWAIQAAISDGSLSEQRYNNYLKMKSESAFNEMSDLDKRKKDRDFGKFVKKVMKCKDEW